MVYERLKVGEIVLRAYQKYELQKFQKQNLNISKI